jgi:hypothetical protein
MRPPSTDSLLLLLPSEAIDNGDDLESNTVDDDLESDIRVRIQAAMAHELTTSNESNELESDTHYLRMVVVAQVTIIQEAVAVFRSFFQVHSELREELLDQFMVAVGQLEEGGGISALRNMLQRFGFVPRLVEIGGLSQIGAASNNEWIDIVAEFKDDPSALYFILHSDPGRFENTN